MDDLDASAGYGLQGPVVDAKGKLEYGRLIQLINSIRKYGYDRVLAREDVTVTVIKRDDEYRFCIGHGQHRVAVLAALGYTEIPVSLLDVIYLGEVEYWPRVYRGIWSKSQAITYTNHLFDFDGRRWAANLGLLDV